jgi:4-hydroxy-tetrahydrodipicolinate synthase
LSPARGIAAREFISRRGIKISMSDKPLSTYAISITPFDENQALDEQAFRGHLRRMAAAGVGVYVCGGGSGEAFTLSMDEQRRVLEIAIEELKGKVEVRAMGREPRTPGEMLAFADMAKTAGFDTIQVYSLDQGHGNQPSPRALEAYFREICEAVDLKLVLSTHLSVGYFASNDLLSTLVKDYPHIVGVNLSTPDITQLVRLVEVLGDRVEIHVGGPLQAIDALILGANGFLSSEANLTPKLCKSIIDHYQQARYQEAHAAFARVLRLFTRQRALGGVACTKAALNMLGLPGGYPRKPRLPASAEELVLIKRMIDELDIVRCEGF